MEDQWPQNVIHITGFGVFRGFTQTNPSWEAVLRLPDHIEFNKQRIKIVKHEVPVTYNAVNEKVQQIWATNPKLVIHCGVSQHATKLCLEQNAFNGNFDELDFAGQKLDCCNVTLPNAGEKCTKLCTKFDLIDIINESNGDLMKLSNHPGNYLCGYIYLKSLDMDHSRTLFIHVPPPNEQFTIENISDGILSVINQCMKQLDSNQIS